MATWRARSGGRILLSGHAQGSVLAVAALWQLSPSDRRHVHLLTYGSPLERIYGRWFPAYFGPAALQTLQAEVDSWRNLYRPTDPIGGPIRLPGDSGPAVDREPLKDPISYGRTIEDPLPAPIRGHHSYESDPAFDEERLRTLHRTRTPPNRPDAAPPAQPVRPERTGDRQL